MKVLFVASECTPIVKVGGLGDVIGSLPKALSRLGLSVKIAMPFYATIDRRLWKSELRIKNYESGIKGEKINVYSAKLPQSSVEVYLIENKKYLSGGGIYFDRTAFAHNRGEIDRFKFFSQAVFRILMTGGINGWLPDIVHCHDWHSGALVQALRDQKSSPPKRDPAKAGKIKNQNFRTIFTIHNLANQGATKKENLMAEGIKNADMVTTVSQSYAGEILTKKYGEGLQSLLKKIARHEQLVGILNGVDYGFWPKKHARLDNIPTFGLVSRLTYQKGIDLLLPLLPEFVKKYNAQFRFLGQGEQKYEKALEAAARRYPKNIFTKIGFDEKLAHKIYRESDFFLMPSRFEPSGLGQMISLHYGTVPIVRATGGLRDSVINLKTGFIFKEESANALRKVMELAVRYFYDKKKFIVLRRNCLRQNFSWDKSAGQYKKIYQQLRKAD